MKLCHRRRLPVSLLVATFAALVSTPSAAQEVRIDCGAMQAMASQAYAEIRGAIQAEDYASAYRLKNVFWEIEKYGGKCQSVRGMGKLLSENRLGPRDSYPSTTIVNESGSTNASGSPASAASPPEGSVRGFSGSSGTSDSSGSAGSTGTTGTGTAGTGTSGTSGTSTQPPNREDGPD